MEKEEYTKEKKRIDNALIITYTAFILILIRFCFYFFLDDQFLFGF